MISREDVNALQNIGRKAGMNVPAQDASAFSRRLGTVVQVYDDGRLDVNMNSADKPSVQYGLRMTTACRGVAVNDVVVVDVFAHVPLVTGVIAHDSSHYVSSPDEALRVWTGSYAPVANDTSVRLWTFEDFASNFGSYETGRTFIGVMNGDGDAIQVHVEGATKTGAGIYAVFDNSVSGPVRVDWLVVN